MPQQRHDWRAYQLSLKKRQKTNDRSKVIKKGIFLALAGTAGATLIIALVVTFVSHGWKAYQASEHKVAQEETNPNDLSREALKALLEPQALARLGSKVLHIQQGTEVLTVNTTLNLELQSMLIDEFKRNIARKRGTPRYVAAVAMDPNTGRILGLAGFSKEKGATNPSLMATYPAASVFKIITASAAAETLNFTPTTRLSFNGGKYTLYKRQIQEKKNKYTNTITFRDSFAQSVNPVFGKLGALKLKKKTLSGYGEKFLFNREIDFDLPVEMSALAIGDQPYDWAEVACGFNRVTKISPLHGALIGATALTGGYIPAPYLVDSVQSADGEEVYTSTMQNLGRAVPQQVSATLNKLMQRTIRSGTAKKSFSGYRNDRILKNLTIGGKTGSISNKSHDVRVDWFVGFAKEKKGDRAMTIAVVVGHQKYIGTRASAYARKAFTRYFSTPAEPKTSNVATTKKNSPSSDT